MGPRIHDGDNRRVGCSISEELYQSLLKKAERSGGTLAGEMRAAFMAWVEEPSQPSNNAGGGG